MNKPIIGILSFLVMAPDAASDEHGRQFAMDSIAFADEFGPKMVSAIHACDHDLIAKLNVQISEFTRTRWWPNRAKISDYYSCYSLVINISGLAGRVKRGLSSHGRASTSIGQAGMYESCKSLAEPQYTKDKKYSYQQWPQRFGPEPDPRGCGWKIDESLVGRWVLPKVGVGGLLSRWTVDRSDYRERWELREDGTCKIQKWKGVGGKYDSDASCLWDVYNDRIGLHLVKEQGFDSEWSKIEKNLWGELTLDRGETFNIFYKE